jgi:hypothetical protein
MEYTDSESDIEESLPYENADQFCSYYDDELWEMYALVLEYLHDNYFKLEITYFNFCEHVVEQEKQINDPQSETINILSLHEKITRVSKIYSKTPRQLATFLERRQ